MEDRYRPPERANRADAEEFARALPTEYVQCRAGSHLWRPSTARWDTEARAYDVRELCDRCTAARVRLISQLGAVLGSKIEYPEGYLATNIGRLVGEAKDAVRLEMVTRFVGAVPRQRKRRRAA